MQALHLSDALQEKVLEEVLELAGTASPRSAATSPVFVVRHGTNSAGKRMHYYLNYSGEPRDVHLPLCHGDRPAPRTKVPASQQ